MQQQDPYASFSRPVGQEADPYAAFSAPVEQPKAEAAASSPRPAAVSTAAPDPYEGMSEQADPNNLTYLPEFQAQAQAAQANAPRAWDNLSAEEKQRLGPGDRVQLPTGEIVTLSGSPFVDANRRPDDRQAGQGLYLREPNALDTGMAAATALSEQIPFADEGIAATAGLITGRGYDDIRAQQLRDREFFNQTNPIARDVGGLGGFGLGFLIPGGKWVEGAGTIGGTAARAGALGSGIGALYGLGNTDGDFKDRLGGAAIVALSGGAGGAALGGASRGFFGSAARARSTQSPQRALSEMGVELTPGQMLGGGWQRAEEALTSVPVAGDFIKSAQRRGVESFDRAGYNWALEPIGQALPRGTNVGREGFRAADDLIRGAYRSALDNVTVDPTQGFNQAITQVRAAPAMRGAAQDTILNTVDDLERRFSMPLSGDEAKQLDSEVAAAMRAASNGAQRDPSLRQVEQRLGTLRQGIRDAFQAADPFAAADKAAADAARARLYRIQEAQQRQGTSARDGLFTAGDFNAAVRAGDTSAGNRAFARGEALGQRLADAGSAVLGNTVPDSGTPLRSAFQAALPLAGGATASHMGVPGAGLMTTGLGGTMLGAGVLYSRPIQSLINRIYRSHDPGAVRQWLGELSALAARYPALHETYARVLRDQTRADQVLPTAY